MRIAVLFFIFANMLLAADIKVLIDLTSGDIKAIEYRLIKGTERIVDHYKNEGKSTDVVVVIHGGAYKFFIEDLSKSPYRNNGAINDAQQHIKALLQDFVKNYPVRFEICGVGMKYRKISPQNIYDFAHPIPSAMIGLVHWQNEGYAYVPVF